jgi:hypothetical protein
MGRAQAGQCMPLKRAEKAFVPHRKHVAEIVKAPNGAFDLVVPEQSQQDHDWKRDSQQPQQCASTKTHHVLHHSMQD